MNPTNGRGLVDMMSCRQKFPPGRNRTQRLIDLVGIEPIRNDKLPSRPPRRIERLDTSRILVVDGL
jgi:hypothetical protein